jgi:septal ring factor EnvC (AmiA/AmiB activator)
MTLNSCYFIKKLNFVYKIKRIILYLIIMDNKKNNRKKKVLDENINETDIIKMLDDPKKHIPIRMRRATSGILKTKLEEQERWEKETNSANVHIEHLQEELNEKNNEIQELKKIIKKIENDIIMEKSKSNDFVIKHEKFKKDISDISKIINKIVL